MTFKGFEYYVKRKVKHTVSIQGGKVRLFFEEDLLTPTMNDDRTIVWENVKYLMKHKTDKQCYRIETPRGHVEVTEDHSMITWTGTDLIETKPVAAMNLIVNNGMDETHKSTVGLNRSMMSFYGYYAMYGVSTNSSTQAHCIHFESPISQSDELIEELFSEVILAPILDAVSNGTKVFRDVSGRLSIVSTKLRDVVSKKFYNHTAPYIPDWVLKMNEGDIIAFLRGVYLACGTPTDKSITFLFRYVKTARKVSRLFKTLGIWGSISKSGRGYIFTMANRHVKWFSDEVGIINPLSAMRINPKQPRELFTQSKVTKVIPMLRKDRNVYDIEVENTHRFFANDFLVHNTDSVYLQDPFADRERVERVCKQISVEQQNDFNVKIDMHNLELEDAIDCMYFFRNNKGEFVKKLYAYKKEGADKMSLKGISLVRGTTSQLAKTVFGKHIEPDMLQHKDAQYSPEQMYKWVSDLFLEDPDQLSKRFRPKKPSSYKRGPNGEEPTSIHYAIAKQYGEGEFMMVPNTAIGIGKGKKYCLKEELVAEFGDDWTEQVMLTPIVDELAVFIPWEDRKRIKKLQSSTDPVYAVDHLKGIVIKTDNPFEIKRLTHPTISRKDWLALRRTGMRDVNGK